MTPQEVIGVDPAEAVVSIVVPKSSDDIRWRTNERFFASRPRSRAEGGS